MTNVPTLNGLAEFLLAALIPPFTIAFIIHYSRFRNIAKALVIGILSILLLIFLALPFMAMEWGNTGVVAGILAGITGLFTYPTSSIKPVTINDVRNFGRRYRTVLVIVVVLLVSLNVYYIHLQEDLEFQVSDPQKDLMYAGYYEIIEKEDKSIDIVRISSRVEGDYLMLEMELAGDAKNDDAEYRFFIATQKEYFWTTSADAETTDQNQRIVQAKVPLASLENRKTFQVLAIASRYDETRDLDLHDNCYNEGTIQRILGKLFF